MHAFCINALNQLTKKQAKKPVLISQIKPILSCYLSCVVPVPQLLAPGTVTVPPTLLDWQRTVL